MSWHTVLYAILGAITLAGIVASIDEWAGNVLAELDTNWADAINRPEDNS